ncbi:helix-turn-helix domain-containing protein [Desulfolutivibrio sulfoxidireducens]|uniref:helix-turn-helix domain-containing protein n=1 Tax=Desulfolutivibrio sulfoxidireducens TaxID=2773299 RepID=UPI00159D4306|nr:helix-turn-helix transcriptional regulator [Desulfolutivibrio sulfoxidireducens]QLA19295.1 Fis family transcriptional regulator [Desulfolutivibrio sulfoxidireducens]
MSHECHDCIGSTFDDFLKDDGTYEDCQAAAIKKVIAWRLRCFMESEKVTKVEIARRMGTSRSFVDKILDAKNTSITLATILKVARIIGKPVKIDFGDTEENFGSPACQA